MYCYHCGYKFNEDRFESKAMTRTHYVDKADLDAKISYVCPRCGFLIHEGHTKEDEKSLSIACHAELQRGRNHFAKGMCASSLAVIAAIIGIVFLLLARKADIQYQVSTSCPEFWIFLVLIILSAILISYGVVHVYKGVSMKKEYASLLKDINRETFVQ